MSSSAPRLRRFAIARWSTRVFGIGACLTSVCAHARTARAHLPVGAAAQYGASTNDGVTWTFPRPVDQAFDSVITVLQAEGYRIDGMFSSIRDLRTTPRVLGGDTVLVVRAQFLAVALPSPRTSIVLTATYSVASRRTRDAPVIPRANTTDSLFGRLLAIAATARRSAARWPIRPITARPHHPDRSERWGRTSTPSRALTVR